MLGGDGAAEACRFDLDAGAGAPDALRMMYCDAVSYLPDDILCKVDRASMAVSLETRAPFLDHRVAALAARIPVGMNIRGGGGKQVLQAAALPATPRAALFERPKAGFGIPVGEWIKGPLRDWAEELLDPAATPRRGLVRRRRVARRWREHLAGARRFDAGAVGDLDVPGVAAASKLRSPRPPA